MAGFPLIVAHRGLVTTFPENTREAIQAAVACGVPFVEFDVQLSGDGVPVLMHDASLERMIGEPVDVLETSMRSLREYELDTGSGAAAHIPALSEILEYLDRHPRVGAFVEIKRDSVDRFGLDAVLSAVLPGVAARHTIISFASDVVRATRQRGHRKVGWVIRDWNAESQRVAEKLRPDYLFCNHERIPDGGQLWSGPWQWVLYEIVDPDIALGWYERGAGLIESMDAAALLADPRLSGGALDEHA